MLPIKTKLAAILKLELVNTQESQVFKSKKSTAVKAHMLMCDQLVSFDDFKVLASSYSEFHLKNKESLLISGNQSILYKNKASLPLYLFDYLHKYFTVLYHCLVIFIIHTLLFTFCCFQE